MLPEESRSFNNNSIDLFGNSVLSRGTPPQPWGTSVLDRKSFFLDNFIIFETVGTYCIRPNFVIEIDFNLTDRSFFSE